jgi:16S rRNA (uracil1498-N3)-methyltransferase
MLPRFLVPSLREGEDHVRLPPDEARHLTRVLRLTEGAEVMVFDGRGLEFRARVVSAARDSATVALLERLPEPAAPSVPLTLVQAVLKGDAMDDVIRDATMVGVEAIQPVVSARTTVKEALLPKAVERWRRIALASAKQCGRSRLPGLAHVTSFSTWASAPQDGAAFLLVEPSAVTPGTRTLRDLASQPVPPRAVVVVGPEGGWTNEERDLALRSGCVPLSLGRLTLRADSVPLAATAALLALWE